MFWYIVLATIPGGIIGYLLDHFLEDALNRPIIIAIAIITMGIILSIVDKANEVIDETLDCISLEIREGWQALGEITGATANEEVVNRIFEKFCVGK